VIGSGRRFGIGKMLRALLSTNDALGGSLSMSYMWSRGLMNELKPVIGAYERILFCRRGMRFNMAAYVWKHLYVADGKQDLERGTHVKGSHTLQTPTLSIPLKLTLREQAPSHLDYLHECRMGAGGAVIDRCP
jgi:hypothetical protein